MKRLDSMMEGEENSLLAVAGQGCGETRKQPSRMGQCELRRTGSLSVWYLEV